jgi:ribose/xylose/arabinose/galactoside ABC-type transport system permease subunit
LSESNDLLDGSGGRRQWTRWLNALGPAMALVIIYAIFCVIAPPSFSSSANIETILRQTTIVGIGALGMTLVIVSGGIDLSVGSMVAMTTVLVAWVLRRYSVMDADGLQQLPSSMGWLVLAAAALAVLGAGLCGLVNGLIVTQLRVVPFIATLGTLLAVRGAAKGIAESTTIRAPATWLNDLLRTPANHRWMILPRGVWVMFALAILTWALLKYARLGRHIVAVGSNEQAARLCGIGVTRVKLGAYAMCGLLCGVAGLMQYSRLTEGDPTVAQGLELEMVAAVVIGGGSLSGGQGSVPGTLVGALILAVIRSGCSQMQWHNWKQEVITGGIIIVAVSLDRLRHRQLT